MVYADGTIRSVSPVIDPTWWFRMRSIFDSRPRLLGSVVDPRDVSACSRPIPHQRIGNEH